MLSDPQPITRDTFREKIFASDPESIREKEIEFLFDILDYNDDDVIDKKDFRIISWIVWCKMAMECKYYYFVIDIEIYYSFAAKSDFAITTLSSTVTLKSGEPPLWVGNNFRVQDQSLRGSAWEWRADTLEDRNGIRIQI